MPSKTSDAEIMGKSETDDILNSSPDKLHEEDRHGSHDSDEMSDMNGDAAALSDVKDEPMSCSSSTAGNEEPNEQQQEELISQTRTSARVSLRKKEERKESEGSEDYDPQQHQFNVDPNEPNDQGNFMDVEGNSSPANHYKKAKRAWELWSSEDKNHFFEALNECGKNFDAMQQSFQTKKFKKNKEQIRTFYYRTWHKISKHIDFPKDLKIKKSCCELYGLCNYGVLRKKTGSQLDDKYGANLQQLVFEGHTTVRVRGRMFRLKTPTCAALKKMKDLESGINPTGSISKSSIDSTIPSLPDKVILKLEPNCYETFVYVNKAAFANPNVCITVSIQRRLNSVITYLEKKWKPLEKVMISEDTSEPSNHSKNILPNSSSAPTNRLEKLTNKHSELWIQARQSTKLVLPSLQTVEPITSASLSLSQIHQCNPVKMVTKNNNDAISKQANDIKISSANNTDENMTVIQTSTGEKEDSKSEHNFIDTNCLDVSKSLTENDQVNLDSNKSIKIETEYNYLQEAMTTGWNATTGGSVTVGELFLMLGGNQSSPINQSKQVIELTYGWRPKLEQTPNDVKLNTAITNDTLHSSNSNLKSVSGEEKPFSFGYKTSSSLLTYLGIFTGVELNRKQKGGKSSNRTPPNNNGGLKAIILSDGSGTGKDAYQTLHHPEQQGVENSNIVIANEANTKQDRVGVPVINDTTSKGSINTNTSPSNVDSFRRPIDPPLRNLNAQQQHQREMFRQQLDLLVPKYTQRKGRPLMRSKNIVSRQLPLQPKILPQPLIKTFNGNVKIRLKSNQQHPIQLLQQNNTVIEIKESPISIQVAPRPSENFGKPAINLQKGSINKTDDVKDDKLEFNEADKDRNSPEKGIVEDKTSPEKKMESPEEEGSSLVFHNEDSLGSLSFLNDSGTSNSGLLHFRSPSAASDNAMYDNPSSKLNGDNFLDSVLEVSNGACSVLQTPPIHRSTSPPSSPPSSHLNVNHSQSYFPELSLTSFLNNFGSSSSRGGDFNNSSHHDLSKSLLKMRHPSGSDFAPHLMNEDSQQSTGSEVDRQLISMMNENSVDFTSKFAKLASAVTSDTSADA